MLFSLFSSRPSKTSTDPKLPAQEEQDDDQEDRAANPQHWLWHFELLAHPPHGITRDGEDHDVDDQLN
jgi:hypothetical protein